MVRLGLVLAADVLTSVSCALGPLAKSINFPNVKGLSMGAVLENSNLDILIGVLVRCILYLSLHKILRNWESLPRLASSRIYPRQLGMFVLVFHHTFQLALLAKMVIVAAHGEEGLLPDHQRLYPGMLAIYCSCLGFLLYGFIEKCMIMNVIQKKILAGSATTPIDVQEPLLYCRLSSEKKHSNGELLAGLLRLIFKDFYPIIMGLGVSLLAAVAEAFVPYLSGKAIVQSAIDPDLPLFKRSLLGLAVAAVASGVLVGIQSGVLEFTAARVGMRLRAKFFYHLLQQEVGFFDEARTGDLISRLHTDIGAASDMVSQNLTVMIRSTLHILVLTSFMLVTCWRLTVVSFVMVPFTECVAKFFGGYFAQFHKDIQSELAEASTVVEETISSIQTVRTHAAEDYVLTNHRSRMWAYFILRKNLSMYFCGWVGSMTWAPKVVTAVVLYLGGYRVHEKAMTPGDLVVFMLCQQALAQQSNCLIDFMLPVTQAIGAIDKVLELMKRRPKVGHADGLIPGHSPRSLELRSVEFTYPLRPTCTILNRLSLMVNPGEFVALVGPSGCGKSTVFNLLQRLYLPDSGDIVIDGRDVGTYDPRWLKKRMCIIPEAPVLFSKSIKDNILIGTNSADDIEIEEACRLAGLHDFVMSLPFKYDTPCGEKGIQLSRTQKWRVAVARALVLNPSILLIDEVPALESDAEDSAKSLLEKCCKGRTVLLATQNHELAQYAQKIVVIADGQVAE